MKFFIQLPTKKYALFCTLLVALALTHYSCKKVEMEKPVVTPALFSKDFFTLPANINKQVARVADKLKEKNNTSQFITAFAKNEGYAIWAKAKVSYTKHTATQLNGFTSIATNNAVNNTAATNEDTTVIIPLVLENTKYTHGFILAKLSDSVTIFLYRNSDYKNLPFASSNTSSGATAESLALQMMQLDNAVFGYTQFEIKDKRLFAQSSSATDTAKIWRMVDLGNTGSTNATGLNNPVSNFMQQVCITVTNSAWVCNTPTDPRCINGCDHCGYPYCYLNTTTTQTCYSYDDGGPWGDPPQIPPAGGGGSGGGSSNPPPPPPPPANPWPPIIHTILNPCAFAATLANNQVFKNLLQYLQDHANDVNDTTEHGFIYNHKVNGGLSLEEFTGVSGEKRIKFTYSGNIDGMAHNHFVNSLSIFSPDDLLIFCNTFNEAHIVDSSTFTMPLVTYNGPPYMLMIEDITKFRQWAANWNAGNLDANKTIYAKIWSIKETNSIAENELLFLKYLKRSFGGSGLKLFKGNANFTQWTPKGLDGNDNEITAPCGQE